MGNYKKCPRCELNWIVHTEDLCDICKFELGKANISLIEDDDDEMLEEPICPECKVNYLEDGEDICAVCRTEKLVKKPLPKIEEEPEDEDESWREFVEDDVDTAEDDTTEISLSLLQEEEEEEIFDGEESLPDDFDESILDFDDTAIFEDDEDIDDLDDEKDD